jgi:hypothetical protein
MLIPHRISGNMADALLVGTNHFLHYRPALIKSFKGRTKMKLAVTAIADLVAFRRIIGSRDIGFMIMS